MGLFDLAKREKMNAIRNDFFLITIRGRFAYSVCCIENAVEVLDKLALDWSEVFDFLWKYPTSGQLQDLGLWHEVEMECIPSERKI